MIHTNDYVDLRVLFGFRIWQLRTNGGWDSAAFARELNITEGQLLLAEKGAIPVTHEMRLRMARAIPCGLDEFDLLRLGDLD